MRQDSLTAQMRARIQTRRPDRFWQPRDFDDLADPKQVDRVLFRLATQGVLRPVRRGLYWRGRVTRFGMSRPGTDVLVAEVAGRRGVGPAGLTAANDLGLTSQVPAVETFAVPHRPPRPIPAIRFVDRSGRPGRVTSALTPVEVAVLEVLGDWDRIVEMPDVDARHRLAEMVRTGEVRGDRLARAAVSEPAAVRERLREVLVTADVPDLAEKVPPARSESLRAELVGGR
jgi:hypothetical protein